MIGAGVPVTSKVLTYSARMSTRDELHSLSGASAQFFRDTKRLPNSIAELLVNSGDEAWTGPYLDSGSIAELSGYQIDGWSRPYEFEVNGDVLTITSAGEDAIVGDAHDLGIRLNVNWIRREQTLTALRTINQAIVLYNGQYQATSPLSFEWPDALGQLVAKGFLPQSAGYESDAWGRAFAADPVGKSPLVRVISPTITDSNSTAPRARDDAVKAADRGEIEQMRK